MALVSVHIIESPSEEDLLLSRHEGGALEAAMKLHDIPTTLHTVISSEMFDAALERIVAWHADGPGLFDERTDDAVPVLHISCHGATDGIGFANGDQLDWTELTRRLRRFQSRLRTPFVLAASACMSFSYYEDLGRLKRAPFVCLVGTSGKPTWSETLVGFSTLYYQMECGVSPIQARDVMRSASLHDAFRVVARSGFKDVWSSLVADARAGRLKGSVGEE